MLIDFFTKETPTSSFIQDVFSTVNYEAKLHIAGPNDGAAFLLSSITELSPIVLWDLDSFKNENEQALSLIRKKYPDTQVLAYAETLENYTELSNKLYDIILSVESIKLHLMTKIAKLKEIYNARQIFNERMSHLVGKSEAMRQLRKSVERAIIHTGPVLIQGETGVGKELIARAVSCMYDKFVTINCSAIPDALFESELFGHTRGSFTGALTDHVGLFETADGGAIFLDEIGDMPLHAQVKLLRVLQNKEIRPVGATKSKHIEVRIIAATNRDLHEAVRNKTFREDLYYRLNVIPLKITPLRERKEDIEDLANYFIQQYQSVGEQFTLSKAALEKLRNHSWYGNIRELENVIQRALCFTNSSTITPEDLQLDDIFEQKFDEDFSSIPTYDDFRSYMLEQERKFLKQKVHENNGSVRITAEKLGLLRTALYNRLNHLGIDVKELH